MATKKTAVKKVAAKKVALKSIPYKKPAAVKFVSFSFGATIPTQSFGNVTPRIEVQADTYEAARDFAIPKIEALYERYAELKPVFMGKIVETEKNVAAPAPKASEQAQSPAPAAAASAAPTEKVKSDAVLKAEKAIGLAMTDEATQAIQDQIGKSVKIDAADKPALYELVLKKRKELKA